MKNVAISKELDKQKQIRTWKQCFWFDYIENSKMEGYGPYFMLYFSICS